MTVKFVQVQACREEEGMIAPCPISYADFFSVYLGEPGGFDCIADFYDLETARSYASSRAEQLGATLEDLTIEGTV